MSNYGNGNSYYNPNIPHSSGHSQSQYHSSYDNPDAAADTYSYSDHSRHNSASAQPYAPRHNDELFIAESNPATSPSNSAYGGGYRYQTHSPTQSQSQQYNPQSYGSSVVSLPNPQHYGGVARNFAPLHQPYNPALYADNNISSNQSSNHPYGFSPTSPQATASFPSPTAHQQAAFGRNPSVQHGRAGYTSPAPPPLPVPPSSAQSPTDEWGNYPTRHSSNASHQYHRSTESAHAPLPSPPSTYNTGYASHEPVHRYNSSASHRSNPLPPTPEVPQHQSLQRQDTLGRRPLPPPPPPNESDSDDYFAAAQNGQQLDQDDLFAQVENMAAGVGSLSVRSDQSNGNHYPQPDMTVRNGGRTNGHHLSPGRAPDTYGSDSDVEAAAGLAALRMAEEQEQADIERRRTGGAGLFSTYASLQSPQLPSGASQGAEESASDSDYVPVDVGSYGGNFDPQFTYGGGPNQLASGHTPSTSGSQRRSERSNEEYDPIHPFPSFSAAPPVDTYGTGGLGEPTPRRRSYDEGDEVTLTEPSTANAGEPPDMFYHPGMSTNRPLPPPPANTNRLAHHHSSSSTGSYEYWRNAPQSPRTASYPTDPNTMHMTSPTGSNVPRSTSLLQHSNTPQTVPIPRSKTDAEQTHRARQPGNRQTFYGGNFDNDGNVYTPGSGDGVAIDLPALPSGKRFNPSKLSTKDFSKCAEPWALSSIISWLRQMTEGENDLKEGPIQEGLVALFTHKVPTMNIADAETLASRVVAEMYKAGTLVHEEEWLKFSAQTMTGVIYQLTGAGCYSPKLHVHSSPGRCYAHHCQRTLKKIDLMTTSAAPQSDDWATFHKLKKEDLDGVSQKEIDRQNILHEIVQGEVKYMQRLDVLRHLYRDRLLAAQPPIVPPKKLDKFIRDVFSKVDAVKKANEDHLLPQMKYRQQEQGPWIVGFSDIFREWIRKAKQAYIEYSSAFPYATFLMRQEKEKNMLFKTFLDNVQKDPASLRLDWNSFLKDPITRLQRYGLLIETVLKKSTVENEEKRNLLIAREEIKAVTLECDARVADMSRQVDLTDLQAKLILRPDMHRIKLNLDHLGRELIFKGDLLRMGGNRFNWLETHALLFDHYLVLSKTIKTTEQDGVTKSEKYDVSRLPIPMDLLVLESEDDDPVMRGGVRGIAAVNPVNPSRNANLAVGRGAINTPLPGMLTHTNTNTSQNSSDSKSLGGNANLNMEKDEKIMYPFRVKHLGKETYTLFAPSAANRAEWCDKLIIAKTKHAAALFAQNREPFRLRVMADSAFAYETAMPSQKSITIKGTPLDRSIDEVEKLFQNTGRPVPSCRARVNCATGFNQPYGKQMVAVGTDIGVYISEYDNPRGWTKAIQIPKVTQVAVLEQFSLMLLISDKSLIAYHLDAVCPVGGVAPSSDSSRRAPQKLSGARDIGFFATGVMKDRTLVFYKKRESLSSTFKVLEPVYQKSTEKKSRLFRSGRTEFFREYDEFYIPTECTGINLYNSSLAISTSKGFEVLTLDKKQPWSVPDLKQPHVATIAARLEGQKTRGMFRLSDQEFLLCYEDCAVYVNKHGDISRSVIMEFEGKAVSAAMYGPYVLLFDQDFVEIRNAQSGRLRQVVSGRDVKCLDDGLSGGSSHNRTIKLSLQHPQQERTQVIVELVLNEGQKD
ncbi:hypothetical protein DM02DRAFT_662044 [Periconia macrospinosa]|uniref:Rho1 guanine nucleotide exchange factor 3 n=1 Tax=Periconia macrospinosa TaxID=97972 RepID=A0A2V1D5P0_9PLEO|nr:hypothetical protein DM02DRAFT_662044 [Periconia macrospinosa]